MERFTLSLRSDVAEMIRQNVEPLGGTVPGYAAQVVSELAQLEPAEQMKIRAAIASIAAGKDPFAPTATRASAKITRQRIGEIPAVAS